MRISRNDVAAQWRAAWAQLTAGWRRWPMVALLALSAALFVVQLVRATG